MTTQTKFANHPTDMWQYDIVRPEDLGEFDVIGFGFENVEVFSMDAVVVNDIVFDGISNVYYTHHHAVDDGRETRSLESATCTNYLRIHFSKEKLETEKHVCINKMFGQTDEENVDGLGDHFRFPDLCNVSLFNTKTKTALDINVPWSGDDEYYNNAVRISETDDEIILEVKDDNKNTTIK